MPKPDSPGAALVARRWAKTTAAERHTLSLALNNARWSAYRADRAAREAADRAECALRLAGAQKP
jgi:hypothetical protein